MPEYTEDQIREAMPVLRFTCVGQPATAGSKRAFTLPSGGVRVTDTSGTKGKSWRAVCQDAAAEAMNGDGLLREPLSVHFHFYVPRPKGHYGSGRNADKLKPSAPQYPAKRPDVTKWVRAVEDALTGVVWHDDAQIVRQLADKDYGEPARCEVSVMTLEVTP